MESAQPCSQAEPWAVGHGLPVSLVRPALLVLLSARLDDYAGWDFVLLGCAYTGFGDWQNSGRRYVALP